MANNYKYINEYNRIHYKQFKVSLSIEEYNKLKDLLKDRKMNNADLLRWAIDKLMKEKG